MTVGLIVAGVVILLTVAFALGLKTGYSLGYEAGEKIGKMLMLAKTASVLMSTTH